METTTQNHPTVTATALRYGLLMGLANIVFSFLVLTTGQTGNTWLGWVSILLIPVASIVLAQRDFRSRNGGFMSYGEGMGIGTLLSLVSGLLSTTFSFLYRLIDPEVTQRVADQLRAKFEEAGSMSDEQIDQAVALSQKFTSSPVGFIIGVAGAVIIGAILSLIISAIFKNAKPEFE